MYQTDKHRRHQLLNPGSGELKLGRMLLDSGLSFTRQQQVGPYLVDYALPDERIAIEVDHPRYFAKPTRRMKKRQAKIESWGWRFARVPSNRLWEIWSALKKLRD